LSDYARCLQPHVLLCYKKKISAVGIDPFLIPEDQLDADSLPAVESIDLVSYLVLDTSFYTQESFKAFKSLQAYNYVKSGFVESVKAKVLAGKHVVLGKVKHSQKWNDPSAHVWIIATPGGTILSAHCRDCLAGLGECCSHVASILFYLEMYHRHVSDISPTDLPNSWLPRTTPFPRTNPMAEMRNIDCSSAKKLKITCPQLQTNGNNESTTNTCTPSATEMAGLFEKLDTTKFKSPLLSFEDQHFEAFLPTSHNVATISELADQKYLDMSYDDLLEECSKVEVQLSDSERKLIEEDTRDQARGSSFFKHRAGRIGASISKQASATNPAVPSKSLIKTICYPKIFSFTTAATEHGCKHEKQAIAEYRKMMETKHKNFKVEQCGMFVHPEHQFLHATPDFICSCAAVARAVVR